MQCTIFVTATDTGAGKTVFTALLAASLRARGVRVAALKPICSGGRDDARMLSAALGDSQPLDEINPWYFRAAIAPLLAARKEHRQVRLAPVRAHIERVRRNYDVVLVEGAGGLLAPLGIGFNSRDLISALDALPVVVAPNQLGVVNHILLTLEALPGKLRAKTPVILRELAAPDTASASNPRLLADLSVRNVHRLPWLGTGSPVGTGERPAAVRKMLAALAGELIRR